MARAFFVHSRWLHTMTCCVPDRTPRADTRRRPRRVVALAAALSVLAGLSGPVAAQRPADHRVFPAAALRGELVVTAPPEVLLNGRPDRLAPGARIRGVDNLLVMSGAVAGQRLAVNYTREPTSGLLLDVWLLRPVERDNRPWPTSEQEARRWNFDPSSQTWKKP